MAFTVDFYQFAKAVNSTKRPAAGTAGLSASCILKDGCSIYQPQIQLQLAITTTPLYNYAFIAAFDRYYFIDNWTFQDRLWTASLTCDVLGSWRNMIGAKSYYVVRSSAAQNGKIRDDLWPVTGSVTPTITYATDVIPWWYINGDTAEGGTYVVGIISGNDIIYYAMTPTAFKSFCGKVLDPTLSNYGGSSLDISDTLAKMIFKPFDYITNVTYLPIDLETALVGSGTDYVDLPVTTWKVGFWTLSGVSMFPIKKAKDFYYTKRFVLPNHPQKAARGQYMNTAPFTEQYISLPRIGSVPVDTSITQDCDNLDVYLHIDLVTGEAFYELFGWKSTDQVSVFMGRYSVQLGVNVPLVSDSLSLSNAFDYAAAVSSGIAGESPASLAGSASSILKTFEPHLSSIGNYGGFLGMQNGAVTLISIFRAAADDDNTHAGRPLYEVRRLDTIPGYIKVYDADIDLIDAFKPELELIKGYMEGGFYWE